MPKIYRFRCFLFLFFLSGIFVFHGTVAAQLAGQMGAMDVAAEMDGGGVKKDPPKVGGKIGDLGKANAERNAGMVGNASSPENSAPAADGGAAPAASKPAAKPAERDIMQTGWWGPGNYFSTIKVLLFVFVFFFWVYATSWMNGDMERQKNESRENLNLLNFVLFALLLPPLLFAHYFWAAFPVVLLANVVNCMVYVGKRNAKLPPHEKVLTGEHIAFCYATLMNKIGIKVKVKKRMVYEVGAPIDLEATGKNVTPQVLQGRLLLARNAPGYNEFRQHLFDALSSNATHMMFDFTPERTLIRHQVDGVWLDLPPMPRVIEKGQTKDVQEEMLEAAKMLVGVNPADRRSRQAGMFLAVVRKKTKYDVEFLSQGTPTGEAAMIQFIAKKVPFRSLDELGMRPEMQPKLLEQLNAKQGLFIISAPLANGLRSSMDLFARNSDRFTRDVVNIEDAQFPSEVIENVILGRYDSAKGETPMTVLPDIIFKEPHALIVKDLSKRDVLEYCLGEVDHGRLFITMTRAKDTVEAMIQFLATKTPAQTFVTKLNGVICQRLIRKLCPDCKEPYQPAPQLLQQLGLRPDQVKEFYRPRTPLPDPNEEKKRGVCETCNGIGYKGRTALFELLVLNDDLRAFILGHPNPAAIRQAIAKSGQTGFFYEGVLLLMKGATTVEELSRVMKM